MLKNAYLQEAIAQRRQLVSSSLRPSKRLVKKAQFHITVRIPEPLPKLKLFSGDLPEEKKGNSPASLPSPMEGIPERSELPAPESVYAKGHNNGVSPIEGLRSIHPTIATLVGSNTTFLDRPGSPVEGLVQETSARPVYEGVAPADARAFDVDDDDFDAGFDDGGWAGGFDDFAAPELPEHGNEDAFMPPPKPRAPRRQVKNPGIRLRNQLPRKSLVYDPQVGRQEEIDEQGRIVRRSKRQTHKPSKYWLNQKNIYIRKFGALPTVASQTRPDPKTPIMYKMVPDPLKARWDAFPEKPRKRRRQAGTKKSGASEANHDDEIKLEPTSRFAEEADRAAAASSSEAEESEADVEEDEEDEIIIMNHAKAKPFSVDLASDDETEVADGNELLNKDDSDGMESYPVVQQNITSPPEKETADPIDLTETPEAVIKDHTDAVEDMSASLPEDMREYDKSEELRNVSGGNAGADNDEGAFVGSEEIEAPEKENNRLTAVNSPRITRAGRRRKGDSRR